MGAAADAELLARALRNPGRLVSAPTDVTAAFPYGGVSLGFAQDGLELDWVVRYYENPDPASGALAEVTERSVPYPRISGLIQGPSWDEDLLAAIFSKTTASSGLPSATPAEVRLEGTLIPRVVPAWNKVLFAAEDPKGKSVLFRRPVPRLSLRDAVELARTRKAGLPVVFDPTPDSAYATTPYWQIARLANLTL